ncbi:hypothetical protein ACT6QG_11375 [Xanthobacter sp. TB0136]|uniref:hypothetical protein n=1 Tax=Xanthobacter sp. TB0136 TaxID=3459177 RepID=UPI004039EB4D
MKVLPVSRILLVDGQQERRADLRKALSQFGVGVLLEADTLEDALAPDLYDNADLIVVQAEDADRIPENPGRDGAGLPAILVADLPSHALERACAQAGYDAALGMPLVPRMLYRRIGSVLQLVRRARRATTPLPAPGPADRIGL